MAFSMNGKYGSSQGGNNNETFFSCWLCNKDFKGAHALMVHFDLAHMKKYGCDHLLKPNFSEPPKVSPLTPPPLASFPSQTSSWKMPENVMQTNHLFGQRVENDRNPSSGSGSGGKAQSLLYSKKNHYVAWPYPSLTSHEKQVRKPKPNIGTFSRSLTPSQLPPSVQMTSHTPHSWMLTPSRSQEVNPMPEARSVNDDVDYFCAKCKLAKQLHQQGIQMKKSDKEDGNGKLDLSLKL